MNGTKKAPARRPRRKKKKEVMGDGEWRGVSP